MNWSEWHPVWVDLQQPPKDFPKVALMPEAQRNELLDSGITRALDEIRDEMVEAQADLIRTAVKQGLGIGRGVMVAYGLYEFEDSGVDAVKVNQRVAAWPSKDVPIGEIRVMSGIIDWVVVADLMEEARHAWHHG